MKTTTTESGRPFLPGMGVDWLLPLYDPFTRLLGFNQARRELLLQAELRPGYRVLDIGCGTGTLALQVKTMFPDVEVVGLDPDAKALARATLKSRRRGAGIRFDRGFADTLSYPDASFDRVFSSFMLHHLERDDKARTLREVGRVLKPGGSLHLADFGGPGSTGHGSPLRRLHAHHRLADNDDRSILRLMSDAGLDNVTKVAERHVLWLLKVAYFRAERSLG